VLPTAATSLGRHPRGADPGAWQLGWHSAGLLIERYARPWLYPARIALSAWGTANMRTGATTSRRRSADGARPVWETAAAGSRVRDLAGIGLDRPRST